ncbi:hypothetical protein, partial [Arenibaculum sp.]|uniref:hypothetical protein n=1 Tax=Arenibaculum sp. TaxID=2865862 RepID=UPI002E162B74|nr:hypothetical protein [Arenibaculum sp.]
LASAANTGPVTLDAGPGAVSLRRGDGTVPLAAGDLRPGHVVGVKYDASGGGRFRLLHPALPVPTPADAGRTLQVDAAGTGYQLAGPLRAFRNGIINGAFDVWQRGTAITCRTNRAEYGPDRFYLWNAAGTDGDYTLQRTMGADGIGYRCAIICNRFVGTGQAQRFAQIIEEANVRRFAGRRVTLSFRALKSVTWNQGVSVLLVTGTVADEGSTALESGAWASMAYPLNTLVPVTPADSRFSYTVDIPSDVREMAFKLHWDNSGLAAGAVLEIGEVQVEASPVSTPFERVPIEIETARCQRYYQRVGPGMSLTTDGGTTAYVSVPFGRMRRTPTAGLVSPSVTVAVPAVITTTSSNTAIGGAKMTPAGGYVVLTGFGGLGSNNSGTIDQTEDWLALDAEL